jgi:hypothetical protein
VCGWSDVARIVAIGDVHGDCDQLVKCLLSAGVMDKDNKWIGGKTHVVQTGDVLDRGPDSRKALDLLMDLQSQAKAAGGMLHALIGNHEAMILDQDYRYVHKDELAGFGGQQAFAASMGPDGKYGAWIRANSAAIKINDVLFVHGGIAPKYADLSLQDLNAAVRTNLGKKATEGAAVDDDGPLWYRGLADDDDEKLTQQLDRLFAKHHVRHIVIGHTVVRSGIITARAGLGLIMIDVGMSKTYRGGAATCLLIENGKFWSVTGEQKTELKPQSNTGEK